MQRHDALEDAAPTTRWFSPVVLVVKETAPGRLRARGCIDIRGLNQHCIQDKWPLPRIWDILHQIGGGQYLSCFDAACAFWGVEIEEESRDYFGVITPKGAYRCKRMPFGHKNSASVYCKLMAKVLDMMKTKELRSQLAALNVDQEGEYQPVYDDGRFKDEQRRDGTYGLIITALEAGGAHADYFMADGLLHRRLNEEGTRTAVVVPPTMTDRIIRDHHCPPWAAHASRDRTLQKLRERYWWPGMYTQVLRYTRGCHSCALFKRGTHGKAAPLQLPVVPRQPFEAMATDLYGPLPISVHSGARYILLAICLHSRWVEAIPLRDQTAPTVARAIVQEIVCRYGCPQYLVSDNGACYNAKLYSELCRILQ
ncbi:hypothetical protein FOCC_FOCC008565, partial [Frankliniella occidentalis]